MRSQVFVHIQRMPIAFFSRTQTGALSSRLNNDVLGAQQAFTGTLANVVSNVFSVAITLVMFMLSWQITLVALAQLPLFVLPARWMGRKLQTITREGYDLNAAMNTTMTERFNVADALLAKLYRQPDEEDAAFREKASRGPRHRRHPGDVRAGVLHRPDAGRLARHRAGLRLGRLAGDARRARRRHGGGADLLPDAAVRAAHLAVQRQCRRDDRAGLLRAAATGHLQPL
jgi:hypothetical protein